MTKCSAPVASTSAAERIYAQVLPKTQRKPKATTTTTTEPLASEPQLRLESARSNLIGARPTPNATSKMAEHDKEKWPGNNLNLIKIFYNLERSQLERLRQEAGAAAARHGSLVRLCLERKLFCLRSEQGAAANQSIERSMTEEETSQTQAAVVVTASGDAQAAKDVCYHFEQISEPSKINEQLTTLLAEVMSTTEETAPTTTAAAVHILSFCKGDDPRTEIDSIRDAVHLLLDSVNQNNLDKSCLFRLSMFSFDEPTQGEVQLLNIELDQLRTQQARERFEAELRKCDLDDINRKCLRLVLDIIDRAGNSTEQTTLGKSPAKFNLKVFFCILIKTS